MPVSRSGVAVERDGQRHGREVLYQLPLLWTCQSTNISRSYPMAFTAQSKVGDLLDNPATCEVLEQHMPGVSSHPMIGMAKSFTLEKLASFPQAGLDDEKLAALVSDLAAIN
jgi:hypothetical protein